MRKEMLNKNPVFHIGCDYNSKEIEGFIKYKYKIYCAMCGEEAIVDKSYHDRDEDQDYYCTCEGSKLFAYIEKLKCDLNKFTGVVERKFQILDLLKEKEKLNNRNNQIQEEIKKLEGK